MVTLNSVPGVAHGTFHGVNLPTPGHLTTVRDMIETLA